MFKSGQVKLPETIRHVAADLAVMGAAALALVGCGTATRHEEAIPAFSEVTPGAMAFDPIENEPQPSIIFPQPQSLGPASNIYYPLRLDPNKLQITKRAAQIMRRDTLLTSVGDISCSASAIRDSKGQVIGAATAEHCYLDNADASSIKGDDGKNYVVESPVVAQAGPDLAHLKKLVNLTQFIVPGTEAHKTHDIAIGVAKGHIPQEVLEAYRQSALTPNEVEELNPGTTIYMAGYPGYQPNNYSGHTSRQMNAMASAGTAVISTFDSLSHSFIKKIKAAVGIMPKNAQGSVCSYGDSGARAFILENGHPKTIGVSSSFATLGHYSVPAEPKHPIGRGQPLLPDYASRPVAQCDIAYQLGDLKKDDAIVHVVQSFADVPGYLESSEVIDKFSRNFKQADVRKVVLNGIVSVPLRDGSTAWISNPILFGSAELNLSAIGYADEYGSNNLHTVTFANSDFGLVNVYPHPGTDEVNFLVFNGRLDYKYDPYTKAYGTFTGQNLPPVGALLKHKPFLQGGLLKLIGTPSNLELAYPSLAPQQAQP